MERSFHVRVSQIRILLLPTETAASESPSGLTQSPSMAPAWPQGSIVQLFRPAIPAGLRTRVPGPMESSARQLAGSGSIRTRGRWGATGTGTPCAAGSAGESASVFSGATAGFGAVPLSLSSTLTLLPGGASITSSWPSFVLIRMSSW